MKFVAIYVIFALSACSIKVSTPGRALVPDTTVEEVFKVVVHIVSSSSEFTVISMDKEMGFISASRAAGFMAAGTGKDVMINCTVKETVEGVISVDVTSTLSGMKLAYGMTKDAIKKLFVPLRSHFPNAELTMDGKPYIPEN